MQNYKDYIAGFFNFYAAYNYGQYVMSTYAGESVSRQSYKWNTIPDLQQVPMCLVEPIKQDRNTAYDIGEKRLLAFVDACKDAAYQVKNIK